MWGGVVISDKFSRSSLAGFSNHGTAIVQQNLFHTSSHSIRWSARRFARIVCVDSWELLVHRVQSKTWTIRDWTDRDVRFPGLLDYPLRHFLARLGCNHTG